jgi:PAS domain S-box-containing protein
MSAFPLLVGLRCLESVIDSSPLTVGLETPVLEAIALMAKLGKSLLVDSAGQIVGCLTERNVVQLVASEVNLATVQLSQVMHPVSISLKVTELGDILTVLSLVSQCQIIPIFGLQGQLIGSITSESICQGLGKPGQTCNLLNEIEKSAGHFRLLAESIPQQVWIAQANGSIEYVNQHYMNYCACTKRRISDWEWQQWVHPEDLPRCLAIWQQCLATGEAIELEFRWLRVSDNTYRWHLARAIPWCNQQGEIINWLGTNTDIHDFVSTELALRESERRYQTITSISPVGIFRTDRQGNCLYVNERWCEIAGMSPEEANGDGWVQAIHPQDRELVMRKWSAATAQNLTFSAEYRFQRSDGNVTWVFGQAVAERGDMGEITGYVGTVTDISDRKATEAALAERVWLADFRASVDTILTQSRSLEQMMRDCTEAVVQHLGAAFARIWLLNQQDNVLELKASSGLYTHINGFHSRIPVGELKIGLIAQTGKPHFTNYIQNDPRLINKEWAKQQGMVAFAGYPLIVEGETLGVIAMFSRKTFSESTFEAIRVAANEIAIGIKRQLTAAALKRSEEKYRNLLENSSDWIWEIDENCIFIYASPKVEEILGYTPQEIIGRSPFEFMSSEEAQRVTEIFAPLLAAQQPFKCLEDTKIHQDGHPIVFETSATPIFDATGKFCGYRGMSRDVTERKQAEAALQLSEERFRLLVEGVKDYAIYMLDPQGLVMSWNSGAEYITGYQAGEIIGENFSRFFRPEDIDHAIPHQQLEITKVNGRYETETIFVRKDGSHFWANCILTALRDETGNLRGFSKVTRDITERKLAEESLLRLGKAIESTSDAVAIADTQSQGIYLNPAFVELYGYTLEDLEAAGGASVVFYQPQEHEPILQTLLNGKSWHGEVTMRSRSGHIVEVDLRADAIKDLTGKIIATVCIHTDITQRKRVESDLWLRDRAIAASSNGIAIADVTMPNEPIIYVNPAFERMTGYSAAEVIGQNHPFLQHADINQPELQQLRSAMQLGQDATVILRNYRKDGSLFWNQLNISPVCDVSGKVTHYIGIQTDITGRKQLEQELIIALEKEKELNELKSRFISMISHEFRTPLSTILSSSELLEYYRHKWTQEKQVTHLHRIQIAVQRMTEMLNDILFIGKVEAGILEYKPTSFDLVAYCRHLVADVELDFNHQHPISFTSQFASIQCKMDQKLLGHILCNLLSNAIKYSPDNRSIQFTLTCQEKLAIFAIQDQGIGIPQEDIPHLFTSFHRAQNVNNIPGTGLGLTIVKNCVDIHKGEISVSSTLGMGTTFTVSLPLDSE